MIERQWAMDFAHEWIAAWNAHDLEARLEALPQGEEFIGTALGIKRKHAKRVTNG